MNKFILIATTVLVIFAIVSCSNPVSQSLADNDIVETTLPANFNETSYEKQLNADFEEVLATLGTEEAAIKFAEFDEKYGTNLSVEFAEQLLTPKYSGESDYEPLTDLFFKKDGAVYLSGGSNGLVSSVIGWVAPKSLPGGYFHGAILDLDKYDPNNEDTLCLESAITKGAGYESANNWRSNVNVCVCNPNFTVNKAKLNAAQKKLDYYCDPNYTDQKYGFFKNYVNIFNVVTKEDTYWWYCTKVVWAVWDEYGIDVDSNSSKVDFTDSGLYSLVKTYYNARYFYSSSKAKKAINDYIADARKKIVMAEEIMLSPYMTKVYEKIRQE